MVMAERERDSGRGRGDGGRGGDNDGMGCLVNELVGKEIIKEKGWR